MKALFPSPTLAWYMARMFLLRTAAFILVLVLILQSLDLLGESGKILAAAGNTESDLWTYAAYRSPQIIQLFLPFAVLLATLVTLATLNQNSEIVIAKAAGISAHQILAPLMIAALGIAAANFVFNEALVTRGSQALRIWQDNDYRKLAGPAAAARESWVRGGDDLILAKSVSGREAAMTLHDVTVYDRRADTLVRVMTATAARPAAGGWQLENARVFDVAKGGTITSAQLFFATSVVPRQFSTTKLNANFVPLWELWPQIDEQRAAGKKVDVLEAAAWHKLSGPFSAVLMPLLGAVAAFGLARSGRLFVRAVIGMFLGFAFFVADNFMLAMGNFGNVPPVMAAWAPFLLFLLIGEAVLIRTEE
ncbi:LPS export ABC transporter permease LptG [Sandarakinorhabdus sp.]|uniref:LPS export ABC transporter permease LptG n=1 Tax=Sandarakinorhabdus sp. TaxID=1916663 RepID=UPI00286D75F4|nr:LPS export ABC transporter permease LptG [Sandarakinorhabdus sp.]